MAVLSFEKRTSSLQNSNYPVLTKADLLWLIPFLAAVFFVVFWQLTSLPIRQWDESRLAVNAAEMLENGNLIVTYFEGNPDMWNTKPPFQIWLIALSIKAFGYTEFAVRFPTALAALATMGLLFIFCLRVFKSKVIAVCSVLVLAASQGYMGYHVARNGDYDATLVFFTTFYSLCFFYYLEVFKTRYWWFCLAGLILAVLTKGVAGLMCAPALVLYLIFRGKFLFLLKQKSFWIGVIAFLLIIFSYYFLRESLNPGYLQAVYENELGGRFLSTLEEHRHPWDWYFETMRTEKYTFWYYLVPFCAWLAVFQTGINGRFALFAILFISLYMVIISSAQTKLYWYDAPVYPLAALLIGLAFGYILQLFQEYFQVKQAGLFFAVGIISLIWTPYNGVLQHYLKEKAGAPNNHWETMFGPVMKGFAAKFPEMKEVTFLQNTGRYNASSYFYMLAYENQGYEMNSKDENAIADFKKGQVVVVCNPDLSNRLAELYQVESLHEYHSARAYRILEKK